MAERGVVTLAFDPDYTGESSGEPRNVASPEINTEDFSAGVDFIGTRPFVDRNRIGIIGICGFGGFALNAAAVDKRVKAVATTSMYDMTRVMSKGYFDAQTPEQRTQMLEQLGEQRWKDAENETPALAPKGLPDKIEGNEPQFVKDYFDYSTFAHKKCAQYLENSITGRHKQANITHIGATYFLTERA
jgi:fermentation-respiration switch protein FrsA (DUF1100 family)